MYLQKKSNEPHELLAKMNGKKKYCFHWFYLLIHMGGVVIFSPNLSWSGCGSWCQHEIPEEWILTEKPLLTQGKTRRSEIGNSRYTVQTSREGQNDNKCRWAREELIDQDGKPRICTLETWQLTSWDPMRPSDPDWSWWNLPLKAKWLLRTSFQGRQGCKLWALQCGFMLDPKGKMGNLLLSPVW